MYDYTSAVRPLAEHFLLTVQPAVIKLVEIFYTFPTTFGLPTYSMKRFLIRKYARNSLSYVVWILFTVAINHSMSGEHIFIHFHH